MDEMTETAEGAEHARKVMVECVPNRIDGEDTHHGSTIESINNTPVCLVPRIHMVPMAEIAPMVPMATVHLIGRSGPMVPMGHVSPMGQIRPTVPSMAPMESMVPMACRAPDRTQSRMGTQGGDATWLRIEYVNAHGLCSTKLATALGHLCHNMILFVSETWHIHDAKMHIFAGVVAISPELYRSPSAVERVALLCSRTKAWHAE